MFAATLKKLREERGLTQEQLGEAIHVSSSAISQYERDKASPRRENLILLADFFGVTVAYLEGTSGVEELEDLLSSEYTSGLSVSGFLDMCMSISPADKEHLVRLVSLMVRDRADAER